MTSPAPEPSLLSGPGDWHRSRLLPPVEQVRPGLWSIPVPLPNVSLRYVLVYVFETDAGPYLVDAGWDTEEAYDGLAAGLASIGTRVQDVQGILVTHFHRDHYGLAARVREVSGAWVALHPADARIIPGLTEAQLVPRMLTMLRNAGAPCEVIDLQHASLRGLDLGDMPSPDILLEDGARPDVPGWGIEALWTPGHSPGHLCFWEPRHRLLLSGDHILPGITPNVPSPSNERPDPLGDFLRSLERLERRDPAEVLPAHEHRFTGLDARLRELRDHHDGRFAEVLAALADGAVLGWDVASRMRWSRPWESMDELGRRAATGEAMSHLRVLALRGIVREQPGEPVRWRLADTSPVA